MAAIASLIDILSRINNTLAVGFRWLALSFLALMLSFIVLQVFCRKVLNNSLFWPEDVSLMMMIWVAFAVAPIAYRNGSNVSLDMFVRWLRGRAWFLLSLAIHLLILLMLYVLISEALALIGRTRIRANSIPLSMKYVYMIMPIGFAAMILVALELGLRSVLGLVRPDDPLARPPAVANQTVQQG